MEAIDIKYEAIIEIQQRANDEYISTIQKSIDSIDLLFQDIAKYSSTIDIKDQLSGWSLIRRIAETEIERVKNEKCKT